MKTGAILRGGVAGGVIAAVMLAGIGCLLGVTLPPWDWSSPISGTLGQVVEGIRAAAMLAPLGAVIGVIEAVVCAVVFEFVAKRARWWIGGLVGAGAGALGAAVIGLVPWMASWYAYAYMPAVAPLGTGDPTWGLVAVVAAGVLVGAAAGATYGSPIHAFRQPAVFRWRQVYPSDGSA